MPSFFIILLTLFLNSDSTEPPSSDEDRKRKKREADVEYFYSKEQEQTTSTLSSLQALEDGNSLRLSEALLSSAASGHKVRNIKQKIEDIGENSQLGKGYITVR